MSLINNIVLNNLISLKVVPTIENKQKINSRIQILIEYLTNSSDKKFQIEEFGIDMILLEIDKIEQMMPY